MARQQRDHHAGTAVRKIDRPRDLDRSRRYTEEFTRDAVALVRSFGKTVTEVARQIGVSPEGLRNRVTQDANDPGQGAPGELTRAEREELRPLRIGAVRARPRRWGAEPSCVSPSSLSPRSPLRCRSGPSRQVATVGARVALRAMPGITAPMVDSRGIHAQSCC
ncbi:transposase [Streptomyces sp. NPDC047009]|uniref:transposase n=1 Tax=Streptomyces sp. NPDC047009 TaxID=3154496 RepID=UPI0033DF909A